jgi:chorismate synthase
MSVARGVKDLDDRSTETDDITIRRLLTIDEYRQCQALEREIWGSGDIGGVSRLDLVTAQENGGLVIGAFDRSGRMVGFVYSLLGRTPGGMLKQCSVLLGVHPRFRNAGLGHRLKFAQREAALAQGIRLITWTFDPLLSTNAHLNMHKLGTRSSTYIIDAYGVGNGLNAGMETDRLLVEWWLDRPREGPVLSHPGVPDSVPAVNEVRLDPALGLAVPRTLTSDVGDPVVRIQVPLDIGAMKRTDLGLARAWRMEVRQAFLACSGQGYVASSFVRSRGADAALPAYILERRRR